MDIIALVAAVLFIAGIVLAFYFSGGIQRKWLKVLLRLLSFPLSFVVILALFVIVKAPISSAENAGKYVVFLGAAFGVAYFSVAIKKRLR